MNTADDEVMVHCENQAVSSLAFGRAPEYLASGGENGSIKIWRISDGYCGLRFMNAHESAVTSLQFNKDCTQILSSSFDGTVKFCV